MRIIKSIDQIKGCSVSILTPANSFTPPYVKSLLDTFSWSRENDITIKHHTMSGSHIGGMREKMLQDVLNQNKIPEYVLWIDSDISWSTENFKNILCSPFEITAGIYPVSEDNHVSFYRKDIEINQDEGFLKRVYGTELSDPQRYIEVGESGFGFICMQKSFLEKIPTHQHMFNASTFRRTFKDNEVDQLVSGEDAVFCFTARDLGYKIMVDKTILVGHYKSTMWNIKL